MTLTTLAIHAEAWMQEELNAQRGLQRTLGRIDAAARGGAAAELQAAGLELEGLLATVGPREARRHALLGRLASALGLPARGLSLTVVSRRLAERGIDTGRLDALRGELRQATAEALRVGRKLGAVARYHNGLLEEICGVIGGDEPAREGSLVDARA